MLNLKALTRLHFCFKVGKVVSHLLYQSMTVLITVEILIRINNSQIVQMRQELAKYARVRYLRPPVQVILP